jgi:hypothetical protein
MVPRKVKYKPAWKMRIRSMMRMTRMFKLEDIIKIGTLSAACESISEVDEDKKVLELIRQM